ncbi:MAG: hypothetical protein EBS98_01960 [Chitinophagia bacterium]|nr:hypothetical protein [Chitinophagia bacterium]
MATLYFGWPVVPGSNPPVLESSADWGTASNWFLNSALTVPANAVPTINDHVVIQPPSGLGAYDFNTGLAQAAYVVQSTPLQNAYAASITYTGSPADFGVSQLLLYGVSTLTVAGNVTLTHASFTITPTTIIGGTLTMTRTRLANAIYFGGYSSSITCPNIILNDVTWDLYWSPNMSIVGNMVCNNTLVPLSGSGHVLTHLTAYSGTPGAPVPSDPKNLARAIYYDNDSLVGNLTLNGGYSVIDQIPNYDQYGSPADPNPTLTVTGNVVMKDSALFAGTVSGTGTMDLASAKAAALYQGGRIQNGSASLNIQNATYGGGLQIVYDKGINGSSILGIV